MAVVTWVSPSLIPTALDYVLVPKQWAPNFYTIGEAHEPFDCCSEWGHFPLMAELRLQFRQVPSIHRTAVDRDAIKRPENKCRLDKVFEDLPDIPWCVDVETHSHVWRQHLASKLQEAFPLPKRKPTNPFISHATWELIRERHSIRRARRYMIQATRRIEAASCFAAWKHACRFVSLRCRRGRKLQDEIVRGSYACEKHCG